MSNTEYGFKTERVPVRVQIDVQEGYRLIGLGEVIQEGDEFLSWNDCWRTVEGSIGTTPSNMPEIPAFRRKKTEQKPDPRFGEWVSVHKSYPPADNWEKEWLCWFNYGKAAAQTTKQIYNAGNCSCLTHWMPLPAPPDPEKSEEDQQFEEWYFKTWPEYQDLGLPASHMGFCRTVWKARGELERSRKKE